MSLKIMKIYSQSKFPDLSPITIEVNNNNVKEITSAILLGVHIRPTFEMG
jgi:hypothetical protein